jgi:hypothetical protein
MADSPAPDPVLARLEALEVQLKELVSLTRRSLFDERALLLARLAEVDGRLADPLSLSRHQVQMYSQNGEDGMIAEIFRRIGTRDRFFVEVGIETGRECNTRLLLEAGWRGLWIEGDPAAAKEAAAAFQPFLARGSLSIVQGMISPADIEAVLDQAGVPPTFDFLSLDIDQHTHHLWRAVRRKARVACIEYNAAIPPSLPLEVPWEASRHWDGSNWYGAGLKALELIGAGHGMHLVGCDYAGVNAFFVAAAETAGRFRAPFTAETHFEAAKFTMVAGTGHRAAARGQTLRLAPEAAAADQASATAGPMRPDPA